MSYNVYFYNSMDGLIKRIIKDYNQRIKQIKSDNFFYDNYPLIVTQTEGIKKILYFKFVEENGVILNFKSFNLQSFYNEYCKPFLPVKSVCQFNTGNIEREDYQDYNISIKDEVFWYLFEFFDKVIKELTVDDENENSRKSNINLLKTENSKDFNNFINFLLIFSDLYEQYESYRNLDSWKILKNINLKNIDLDYLKDFFFIDLDGKIRLQNKIYEEKYQIELIKLIINSDIKGLKYKVLKNINERRVKPDFPPNPLFFVAFNNIPYFYLEFLKEISNFIDINFYFLIPSILNKNNILNFESRSYLLNFCFIKQKSFIKDFISFFPDNNYFEDYNYNNFNNSSKSTKSDKILDLFSLNKTLLKRYQEFIKFSTTKSYQDLYIDDLDESIQIFANYTELRELEVIKDKILDILSKNIDFKYDDVIVMAPDLTKYYPYIETVFTLQDPSLPVYIVDINDKNYHKFFKLIEILFELLSNNFNKKDLINLLTSEIIMKKFEFDEKDIEIFLSFFNDYLWGVDYEDIINYFGNILEKKNESVAGVFDFYIEAIFLSNTIGYVSSNSYYNSNAFIEYDGRIISLNTEIEGNFINIVNKIHYVYNLLLKFYKFSKSSHKMSEYIEFLEQFFEYFIPDIEDYHKTLIYFRNKIIDFLNPVSEKEFTVNFEIFKKIILNYLKNYQYSRGWTPGRILFSNMVSLRNIPSKVIAIIGLNDSEFPSDMVKYSFDLTGIDEKSWDRNVRESDKYLFLESILSAKDYLLLSYIGKNPINNKNIAPSILIRILLEDINSNILSKKNLEPQFMPIQPFSKKYYFKNYEKPFEGLKTFNESWINFYIRLLDRENRSEKEDKYEDKSINIYEELKNLKKEIKQININKQFIKFLQSPIKYYLKEVFDISFYLSDYNKNDEFNQYVKKEQIEDFFFNLLDIYIKDESIFNKDKKIIDYYKFKYLKPRGIATEIDFINYNNYFAYLIKNFFIVINSKLSKSSINSFSKKNISLKKNSKIFDFEYNFLKYSLNLDYYELSIDDKIKYIILLDFIDKEDKYLRLILSYFLLSKLNVSNLMSLDKKDNSNDFSFIIGQLNDFIYDNNNDNDSLINYNNIESISFLDMAEDIGIIKKNTKKLEENIKNLLLYYIYMIENKRFLPIFGDKEIIKDIFKIIINDNMNILKLKEIIEKKIFNPNNTNNNKSSNYANLKDFYYKWIYLEYFENPEFTNYINILIDYYNNLYSILNLTEKKDKKKKV